MQVKKEDVRQTIYQCALQEFLTKGYEDASMRTIAKKANTSIGNIYHYYESKDALLDEMIRKAMKSVEYLLETHISMNVRVHSIEEVDKVLDMADSDAFGLTCLLEPEVAIFIKQEQERYKECKERFLSAFRQHLAWHLNCKNPNEHFIHMIMNMFTESIVFIVKSNRCKEQAIADFIRIFRMICGGIISND